MTLASVEDSLQVTMSREVKLVADKSIADVAEETFDLIALPVRNFAQAAALDFARVGRCTILKKKHGCLRGVCLDQRGYGTQQSWMRY